MSPKKDLRNPDRFPGAENPKDPYSREAIVDGGNKQGVNFLSNSLGIPTSIITQALEKFGSVERLGDKYSLKENQGNFILERIRGGHTSTLNLSSHDVYHANIAFPTLFYHYSATWKDGVYIVTGPKNTLTIPQSKFPEILARLQNMSEIYAVQCSTHGDLSFLSKICKQENGALDIMPTVGKFPLSLFASRHLPPSGFSLPGVLPNEMPPQIAQNP